MYAIFKASLSRNVNPNLQISSAVMKMDICENEICVHVCIVIYITCILLLKNISGQVQFKLTAFLEIK